MTTLPAPGDSVARALRTHSIWLALFGTGSVLAGVLYYVQAAGPDGRDPFYAALASQFVVWGVIDAFFGLRGVRDAIPLADEAAREAKARHVLKLLHFNTWLNVLWLASGAALLGVGFWRWSPALCGHGVGVLAQAIPLCVGDGILTRRLKAAIAGR